MPPISARCELFPIKKTCEEYRKILISDWCRQCLYASCMKIQMITCTQCIREKGHETGQRNNGTTGQRATGHGTTGQQNSGTTRPRSNGTTAQRDLRGTGQRDNGEPDTTGERDNGATRAMGQWDHRTMGQRELAHETRACETTAAATIIGRAKPSTQDQAEERRR